MKLAILYTSFRQSAELQFYPKLLNRSTVFRSEVDVIYHNNNPAFSLEQIEASLQNVPFKSLKVIHSSHKNVGGYPYGQFEAILDSWKTILAGGYDWVIHLHPDIFVIDEVKLLSEIERAQSADSDILVVATFGHKAPAYATDFFCFRPAQIPQTVFGSFRYFLTTPIVIPLENLFFNEIFRAGVKQHVAIRFLHGHYHYDIDQLGLWHEHNLRRVELFLQKPTHRWYTLPFGIARHPYRTLRMSLTWSKRFWRSEPQDSLAAQLTAL